MKRVVIITIIILFILSNKSWDDFLSHSENKNLLEIQKYNGKGVTPIFLVDQHQRALKYWLLFQLENKNINLKGLPVLHVDSHPDMASIHSHFKNNGKWHKILNLIDNLSNESINNFDNSLKDVAEVIVPTMLTGISKNFYTCVPEWYQRTNIFQRPIPFFLYEFNKNLFMNEKVNRVSAVTSIENTFLSSPFIHLKDKKYFTNAISIGEMTFFHCLKDDLPNIHGPYILDIDLDFFSSNGIINDINRPISIERDCSKTINLIKNKSSYQNDLKLCSEQISKNELHLFKERLKLFSDFIHTLKKNNNAFPLIISIAASSGDEGGRFTPKLLAKMAFAFLSAELKNL